ncbi:MAG: hypothetical protein LBL86_04535, partial [Coriobacteriales bacterium]|nr:hypothetical protein [Coriobacteriales bacterium]
GLVIGVGINVNRPAEGAFAGAAYLSDELGHALCLEAIAAAALDALLDRYEAWCAAGRSFAPFVPEYREHMALLGEQVCVRDAAGTEVAQGIVQGIDDDARLLLAGPRGTAAVSAGEVTLRPPAPK